MHTAEGARKFIIVNERDPDMGINCMKKTAEGAGKIKSKIKAIFRPKQQKHKNGQ